MQNQPLTRADIQINGDALKIKRMDADGVKRNLSVFIADAVQGDYTRNGVFVWDNEADAPLLSCGGQQASGLMGPSPVVTDLAATLVTADDASFWKSVNELSNPSNDARSAVSAALHEDGHYDLPAASIDVMRKQIIMSGLIQSGTKHYPGVFVDVSDRAERGLIGPEQVDRRHDAAWVEHCEEANVATNAIAEAAAPYIGTYPILDTGEDLGDAYNVEIASASPNTFILKSVGGIDLGASSVRELSNTLKAMDPAQLEVTWMAVRVMAQDFSKKNLGAQIAEAINEQRVVFDDEQTLLLEDDEQDVCSRFEFS